MITHCPKCCRKLGTSLTSCVCGWLKQCGGVGHNWTVSDETKKAISEIDDNIRNAAVKAGSIIVGQTNKEANQSGSD